MAKIFITFFNAIVDENNEQAMPCFYEGFVKGLEKAGNNLCVYHHPYWFPELIGKAPQSVIDDIKSFSPDLVILFNNRFYDLSAEVDCPIVIYETDTPMYYGNTEAVLKNPNLYKYCVCQEESIGVLKKEFGVNAKNTCPMPFFTEVRAENLEQKTNISFIGSRFATSKGYFNYSEFIRSKPTAEEIALFKKIEKVVENNPFVSEGELIEQFDVRSEKIIEHLDVNQLVAMISTNNRIRVLQEIADLGLDLYGSLGWLSDGILDSDIVSSFKNVPVYSLQHNQDIYNSSKICINANHIQARSTFSWRVCDVMASNGCLVTEEQAVLKKFFPNVKVPTFSNKFEAREQCIKLLNDDVRRKEIVLECQKAIDEGFRFPHLLKRMEDFLGMTLHSEKKAIAPILVSYRIPPPPPSPKKTFLERIQIRNRIKNVAYFCLLMLAQIPPIDVVLRKKTRQRLYDKIEKHRR